jgi:hypothetical protein
VDTSPHILNKPSSSLLVGEFQKREQTRNTISDDQIEDPSLAVGDQEKLFGTWEGRIWICGASVVEFVTLTILTMMV